MISLLYSDVYTGYIREIEASFCMDECSEYYIESENGEYFANILNEINNSNPRNLRGNLINFTNNYHA